MVWEAFLDKHIDALAAGQKFKLADPNFPVKELFPGCTFYPKSSSRNIHDIQGADVIQ